MKRTCYPTFILTVNNIFTVGLLRQSIKNVVIVVGFAKLHFWLGKTNELKL